MEDESTGFSVDGLAEYPEIELPDYRASICTPTVHETSHFELACEVQVPEKDPNKKVDGTSSREDVLELAENLTTVGRKHGKYFFYESPLSEETGAWIPVSVPPLRETDQVDWSRGSFSNGSYFPDGELGWSDCVDEDKEMTMWDVVLDMLLAARGKISALSSNDIKSYGISWISRHLLLEQAWKDLAEALADADFGKAHEIMESEPPKWLPDSSASACMLCNMRFHPIMRSRHHCRFCGGLFCSSCSSGRSLLPSKFRTGDPQRVCDVCCIRLECAQACLMNQVSRAAQPPTHDLTDLSTLRSWLNFPWGQSMEYEIYKATKTIKDYEKIGCFKPEKSIPSTILKQAKGLAILSMAKVGLMVTYNVGTGIVLARRDDGSWSPPSSIATIGVGWGVLGGGEVTDLIIVLRTNSAIKTFCANAHLSVGASLSAAAGFIGRAAEANLRAGDGSYAACYTYSCSKGAFVGCSLDGNIVKTRTQVNSRFYGKTAISASEILLGSLPRPAAASALYQALRSLFNKN